MKSPASAPARLSDALPAVESIIVRLTELRQQEPGKERKADYQTAIDRLHALAYRLERDAVQTGRVVDLPPKPAFTETTPAFPKPAPAEAVPKPHPSLPLGPVIVRARRPRR